VIRPFVAVLTAGRRRFVAHSLSAFRSHVPDDRLGVPVEAIYGVLDHHCQAASLDAFHHLICDDPEVAHHQVCGLLGNARVPTAFPCFEQLEDLLV
jgi:hypothetical protein